MTRYDFFNYFDDFLRFAVSESIWVEHHYALERSPLPSAHHWVFRLQKVD